jgi:hypothetical protein
MRQSQHAKTHREKSIGDGGYVRRLDCILWGTDND